MPGGTGYINWDTLYGLNQPQAQAQSAAMQAPLYGPAKGNVPFDDTQARLGKSVPLAERLFNPNVTQDVLNTTKDVSGLQSAYESKYGHGGGYTPGQSLYDAAMSNQAGARDFQNIRNRYAQLWAPRPQRPIAAQAPPVGTPPTLPQAQAPVVGAQPPQLPVPPEPPTPPSPLFGDPLERRRRVGY